MNDLEIFKQEQLITLHNSEYGDITLSGRELHEFLEVKTEYKDWMPRMIEYGFVENIDFKALKNERVQFEGNREVKRKIIDHEIKLDMAKEIAMIQRNEKGKQARQYFIKVEKAWNSPEMIMKRALEFANKQVENLKLENEEKEKKLVEQQPKVIFADAVSTSHTSILVGELAKLIKQNGVDIGQGRLFQWLRDNGYLIKRKGTDYNMPTQKSMELEIIEIKERTVMDPGNGTTRITKTPKVTGKGQQYFINKFLKAE